jgi:hypothetical protein
LQIEPRFRRPTTLHEIEGRILASIAPPEMTSVLRRMVPSIPRAARANMFVGMRAQMPPPRFVNILQFAKSHLDQVNRDKLDQVLSVSSAIV